MAMNVVIIGEPKSGRTALTQRLALNIFVEEGSESNTLNADGVLVRRYSVDGRDVSMQFWDTSTSGKVRMLMATALRNHLFDFELQYVI